MIWDENAEYALHGYQMLRAVKTGPDGSTFAFVVNHGGGDDSTQALIRDITRVRLGLIQIPPHTQLL